MDIEMPIIDGYEATAKIKEINFATPVIILTAYDLRSAKETAEKVHCNLFLTKPIMSKDLLSAVSEFLD
jgi:CheY-like chemotaxis protein